MSTFTSAQELLAPGETALCLFTDGRFFTTDEGGNGSSGFWFIENPQRSFQRVIVFKWTCCEGRRYVELFKALPAGLNGPEVDGNFRGRYTVQLRGVHVAGTTEATWEDFVMSNEHPVTYVTHPSAVQ